jgi:hypothetical protein
VASSAPSRASDDMTAPPASEATLVAIREVGR